RQTEHDSGNAQKLLLSLTEISPVFIDDRIIALRQSSYKAVSMSSPGSLYHFFHGCLWFSICNILPDSSRFQPGVLKDHAGILTQGMACHIPDIFPIDFYASLLNVIKSHKKIDKGGFAAACRSHNGNPLSLLYLQV